MNWARSTFNGWWGCARVSRACRLCYAAAAGNRFGVQWGKTTERRFFGEHHWNEPRRWNRQAAKTGEPWRVFASSMADVFEDRADLVPHQQRLFHLIEETPALTWMLLTKRPENVAGMVPWGTDWPVNVWLGVTAEDQGTADERIPILLGLPAQTRFLSCEPLVGPLDLTRHLPWPRGAVMCSRGRGVTAEDLRIVAQYGQYLRRQAGGPGIDWVITGGESGPKAVPSHPDWSRSLREQCTERGVHFWFKQWGEWLPVPVDDDPAFAGGRAFTHPSGGRMAATIREPSFHTGAWRPMRAGDRNDNGIMLDDNTIAVRVGVKAAGCELDGVVHHDVPEPLSQRSRPHARRTEL